MRETKIARSVRPLRRTSLTAFGLALLLGLGANLSALGGADELRPSKEHVRIANTIVRQLDRHHYAEVELDDDFSGELLDLYLEVIDPYRQYLVAADLADFEEYRDVLDERITRGDLGPAFEIFNRVQARRLEQVSYFERALDESLEELRFDVPEFIEVDREEAEWPVDEAAMQDLWRRQFKNDVLSQRLRGTPEEPRTNEEIRSTLARRYAALRTRLGRVDADDVFQIYMNVLSRSFDPHTMYMPPVDAETFNMGMSLSFEGIGAVLGSDGQYIDIQRLITAGPAEKSGELKPTDRIIAVGQEDDAEMIDIVGWRTDEAAEKIRGPKGSVVRLSVLPADVHDESAAHTISIVRDEVQLEEQRATSEIVEAERDGETSRVGVIELPAFYLDFQAEREHDAEYHSSARDVAKALDEFEEEGVDGVILDLRNNGGGSLTEALAISGLFLGDVPIVQVRDGRRNREELYSGVETQYSGPLIVMVNGASASASEILAAAIQDYGRGIVVGSRTWGKGSVQTILPVPKDAGQLKLTHAMFYRVSGGSTQARGVTPDVEFPDLFDAEEFGEGSIDEALPWDSVESVLPPRTGRLDSLIEPIRTRHSTRTASDSDWVYIAGNRSLSEEQREVKRLSLVEATRRAEREARNARLLALKNAWRESKGLEPLSTLEEAANAEDEGDEDPYREEAVHVLMDLIPR